MVYVHDKRKCSSAGGVVAFTKVNPSYTDMRQKHGENHQNFQLQNVVENVLGGVVRPDFTRREPKPFAIKNVHHGWAVDGSRTTRDHRFLAQKLFRLQSDLLL